MYKDIILTRASDDFIHEVGQDGGLVSAILIWALDNGYIDAALTSYVGEGEGSQWTASPGVAFNRDDVIRGAGSRYTYSANTLAYTEAIEAGAKKIALVGMSCQSSIVPVEKSEKSVTGLRSTLGFCAQSRLTKRSSKSYLNRNMG